MGTKAFQVDALLPRLESVLPSQWVAAVSEQERTRFLRKGPESEHVSTGQTACVAVAQLCPRSREAAIGDPG